MTHPLHGGITFSPTLDEFAKERAGTASTVLSGGNNTGKSLVLKWLKQAMGKTAYMVGTNRFYHVYHFSAALRDPNELEQWENQFNQHFWQESHNHEQNFIDLNRIITGLSDKQRNALFNLCGHLIGVPFTLEKVNPDSELSVRFIRAGTQNISVASSGTRLLMTLLGLCMDERFKTLLIDEPELGLSPKIQAALSAFLHDGAERAKYFPHLKQVIVATHSHLFLNRADLTSNYMIEKNGAAISMRRVQDVSAFHRLQFNLLGNSLESLFLPSAVVYVEGETDQSYLERVIALRFPARNVVVVKSNGDPKQKLHSLKEHLGDLQKSPLRDRLFVVVDAKHARGLKEELIRIGLVPDNFVAWSRNGIEYVYPQNLVASIFACRSEDVSSLLIAEDVISLNGITKRKKELCQEVTRQLTATMDLPKELVDNLLARMSAVLT
ncbi:MAG TPA: AAA family ATPase [Burkholderiales bacterium]|nr:AAA family ATPase [Burkholderiales bacterium]